MSTAKGPVQPVDEAAAAREVHVGRQAIYDRAGEVVAYELLFRDARRAHGASASDDLATTQVILNTFTEFGMGELVGPRRAFINLTRPFLVGTLPLPFEPGNTVLEILETVAVDAEVVAGARRLVEAGHVLALDDFVWRPEAEPLIELASYIKIDISAVTPAEVAETVRRGRRAGARLLAERVETAEELEWCRQLGVDLFQGFYFARPQVVSAPTLSPGAASCLQLLDRLTRPDLSFEELDQLVRRDAALTYRTLRAVNCAATGLRRPVGSVREALVLLGLKRLRSWVLLMAVGDASDADEEQIMATLARARSCQVLAGQTGACAEDQAFTVGLLAGVADLLGVPRDVVGDRLGLAVELRTALSGDTQTPPGRILAAQFAGEAGDLQTLAGLRFEALDVSRAHLSALRWARAIHDGVTAAA